MFTIGDSFLEVVSPVREGTTAGRFIERIGPSVLAARWAEVVEAKVEAVEGGVQLHLDGGAQIVRFIAAAGQPEGICGIGLALPAVACEAREQVTVGGVTFTLTAV